jgi:hypothetical protein
VAVQTGKAIHDLLQEAIHDFNERRSEQRYPLFRRATLFRRGQRFSAFTRDISVAGIGLLHGVELQPGEIEVSIAGERGYGVRVRAAVVWCRYCGDGWYISGARFLSLANVLSP